MSLIPMIVAFQPTSFLPSAILQQRMMCPAPLASGLTVPTASGALRDVLRSTRRLGQPMMSSSDNDSWDASDDYALNEYIKKEKKNEGSVAQLGQPNSVLRDLNKAWVLLFNADREDESVYTLEGGPDGSSTYVLIFEHQDDAESFADRLSAEGFDLATTQCWYKDQLESFCEYAQFEVSLVPQGALLTPPTENVYQEEQYEEPPTGWMAVVQAQQRLFADAYCKFPGDGSGLPDKYKLERQQLEELFGEVVPPDPNDRYFDPENDEMPDPFAMQRHQLENLLEEEPTIFPRAEEASPSFFQEGEQYRGPDSYYPEDEEPRMDDDEFRP